MLVRLLTDLTKYNPKYTKGSICHCDMVPFCHPNIRWQLCYNLRIENEILAVGEDGFEIIGEEKDCSEAIIDAKNQATFTEQKIQLANLIDNHLITLIYISHDDSPKQFFGLKFSGNSELVDDIGEKGFFEKNDSQRIFSEFVWNYCLEEKKNYILTGKANRETSYYKAYIAGKFIEKKVFPREEFAITISKFIKEHFGYDAKLS